MDNHPGDVERERVVNNLRLHGVRVSKDSTDESRPVYTLTKGDIVEVQLFPERVSRHLIGRLSAKFSIEMASFFDLSAADRPGGEG